MLLCILSYNAMPIEQHFFYLTIVEQALIQMQDVGSAVNVVQYYTSIQPSVR